MSTKETKKGLVIIFTLLLLAILIGYDQYTKNYIRKHFQLDQQFLVGHEGQRIQHFYVTRVENPGAFLSLGNALGEPWHFLLITLLPSLVLVAGVTYILLKPGNSKITMLGYIFILGGGIGNLYDRIKFGTVTDFMQISLGIIKTGIFNMADVFIMVGFFILVIQALVKAIKGGLKPHGA